MRKKRLLLKTTEMACTERGAGDCAKEFDPPAMKAGRAEVWPNLFVVGAAKAGTTSMYAYLSQHPEVFFPRVKEPHFFTQVTPSRAHRFYIEAITRRSDYLKLFNRAAGCRMIGDASPSYLWHPQVPQRIHAVAPDPRIIILLRDPLERAHSHYLMDFREGVQPRPFYEALRADMDQRDKGWGVSFLYYELGLYAAQVKRFLHTFGPNRIKIILFEEMRRDARQTLIELSRFLGLDPKPMLSIDATRSHNAYAAPRNAMMRRIAGARLSRWIGQSVVPRRLGWFIFERFFLKSSSKPSLDARVRDLLCSLYEPDVSELERTLGRSLPELRRSWMVA